MERRRFDRVRLCYDCYLFASMGQTILGEIERDRFVETYKEAEHHHGGTLIGSCPDMDHHDPLSGEHIHREHFSWDPCEWCGSRLGGERFCGAIITDPDGTPSATSNNKVKGERE